MARYEISLRRSVLKDLDKIPRKDVERIIAVIRSLQDDPRRSGAMKLSGEEKYRIRQGDYRVLYSIQDREKSLWVVKVGHRKDVYR